MTIKYTAEQLKPIIESSKTWAEVCRKLNVAPMTGAQSYIKKRALSLGLDASHFVGQSFNRDRKFGTRDALEYCFKNSTIPSHRLKLNLIRDGYKKDECEICKCSEWLGKKLPLELDHIDSDHYNNEISNLQILCPNCHAVETMNRRGQKAPKLKLQKPAIDQGKQRYESTANRKVDRPALKTLLSDLESLGYEKTGVKYGVSGNSIRKWIALYQKYEASDSQS